MNLSQNQNLTNPPPKPDQVIYHIADRMIGHIKESERKYLMKDSVSLPSFSQIGWLSFNEEGVWEFPIVAREGVFVDPIKFLKILRGELISKSKKVREYENSEIVVLSRKKREIYLKIWKRVESQDHMHSLRIEVSGYGILKVFVKQIHTFSLKQRIQRRLKEQYCAQSTFEQKGL